MSERGELRRTAVMVERITTFGDVLRRFRTAAGLTQEDLAERAGLSARGISDLERGRRSRPYFETVRQLADALGLNDGDRSVMLSAARDAVEQPSEETSDSPPANLPVQLTGLVGRDSDCQALSDLLRRDDVRLVTLTGPGGVGKTRLALAVATEVRPAYPGGVYFVPLAPLRDPDHVLTSIAHTLGLSDSSSDPMLLRLTAYLDRRRILLLLDNFEHLLPAVPAISDLLMRCPDLTILATSRSALLVSGEHQFAVSPLSLPDPKAANDAETIAHNPSAALLLQRLSAIDRRFVLTEVDLNAVIEICRRSDGLPLALELAAARARHLTLQELATRLHHRLDLLTHGPRNLPPRQQALRDTIAWSYDLLAPPEQRLLRWLAVFVGGWTLERAEDLCAGADGLPINVVDGLATLVDSSLVRVERDSVGRSWYVMLDTIREFVEGELTVSSEEVIVRQRLASVMIAYTEEADRRLRSGERLAWTRLVEPEVDNVRTTIRWLLDSGDTERALELVGNLLWFWDAVGRGREGRAWGEEVLSRSNAKRLSWAYARASYVTGQQAWAMGDLTAAKQLLTASSERFRLLGDRGSLGQALNQLGSAYLSSGDIVNARALLSESVQLLDSDEFRWDYGLSVFMLGDAISSTDPDAARTHYEQSLTAFRAVGDPFGMAIPITGLGGLAMRARDYNKARRLFEEGLALRRAAGHRFNIAISLTSLGELARYEGDPERALDYLHESLGLFQDLGDAERTAWTLYNLGMVAIQIGDAPSATARLRESLELRIEHGSNAQVAQTIAGLAQVALMRGDAGCAASLLGAVDACRAANDIEPPVDEDGEAEERCRTEVQERLGVTAYQVAWKSGHDRSQTNAVQLALGRSSS